MKYFRPLLGAIGAVVLFVATTAATVVVTSAPTDQYAESGSTATFTMQAYSTNGEITFQWSVSTDNQTWSVISDDTTYSNTSTQTLTINGVTPAMNGYRYRCMASSIASSSGREARLYVPDQINWDSGATEIGTDVVSPPANYTDGRSYYKVTTQNTTVGAWRTALRVTSGTANIYLKQNAMPTSTGDATYRSERPGTAGDGFVVPGGSFAEAQTWYLMVVASEDADWTLVTGEAYVQDLGTVAADETSSSGTVSIGPEGHRFFKSSPTTAAAWQLWLNDGAGTPAMLTGTPIAVRRTSVPLVDATYDHQQLGHMLLVPPYLNSGDTYYLSVKGEPDTTFNLDSRSAPITDVAFGDNTAFTISTAGYAVYRTQVPVDQIGWQAELRDLSTNVDLAVRRDNAGSEWFNDAFSEAVGTVGDSVTIVPPSLTNGTYYITLYHDGSVTSATGTLVNRVPFSDVPDDVLFLGTSLNDESTTSADNANPNKVGWRYFRVGVTDAEGIQAQLGKAGWELAVAGAPADTEIALRRNFLPGKWTYRNGFAQVFSAGSLSTYYQDFNSASGLLQRPGHQADIWYVGIYSDDDVLGNFSLVRSEISGTPTGFTHSTTAVTDQAVGIWKYFKFEVPEGEDLLGWDLRITDVTGGTIQTASVLRETPPGDGITADFTLGQPWTRPYDSNGVYSKDKFLIKSNNGRGPTTQEGAQSYNLPGWLYAGTYYLGVKVSDVATSYTVTSRGIGTEASSYPIKVTGDLAIADGTATITDLAPREIALYRVTVPEGLTSWEVKLSPTGTGEASLLISNSGRIPNNSEPNPIGSPWWGQGEKPGNDFVYAAPSSTTDNTPLKPGTYYVMVMGEGNSPAETNRIGTGDINAVLSSQGNMAAQNLGTAAGTETVTAVSLESEEINLYQFTVAPGTLSVEVHLTERTGNPRLSVVAGNIPGNWGYSNGLGSFQGVSPNYLFRDLYGINYNHHGSISSALLDNELVTLASPEPGTYTIAVRAVQAQVPGTYGTEYADATANLRVVAVAPVDAAFSNSTTAVTEQGVGTWRYFKFEVPEGEDLLGWDLRITDVTGGTIQTASVLRDALPGDGITADFILGTPWTRHFDADGVYSKGKYLTKSSNGRGPTALESTQSYNLPGWLYAGTYYLGVKVSDAATSYTVTSRGIGTETSNYPIKVAGDLAVADGTATITDLAPRDIALYRVTVPEGLTSWEIKVAPAGTGEASLLVSNSGRIPSNTEPNPIGSALWGQGEQPGNDFVYAAPTSTADTTTLKAGTYYVMVIGEGNSPAEANRVGTGNINATLSSQGNMVAQDLGTATGSEIVNAVSLEAEEIKLYQFTVAPGTLSVEVSLTERTGNPRLSVVAGDIPGNWGYSTGLGSFQGVSPNYLFRDPYGVNYNHHGSIPSALLDDDLVTIASPEPGTYTIAVRAVIEQVPGTYQSNYADATANLRVVAVAPVDAAFSSSTTAVTDQSVGTWRYFKFEVPEGEDLLGWDLRVTDVTGGTIQTASVLRDTLPGDGITPDFALGTPWTRFYDSDGVYSKDQFLIKSNNGRGPTAQESTQSYNLRGWLYAGTYYLGVKVSGVATSYTVISRGIGTESSTYPIKVAGDLAVADGTANITDLAPRDIALYRVTVPEGLTSWEVKLAPVGTGEASLLVSNSGRIPSNTEPYPQIGGLWGQGEKPGNDFVYAAPTSTTDTTTLKAGTYYVMVVGEGNSPAETNQVGNGNINAVLTSQGNMAAADLGSATATESVTAVNLESEEINLYQFTVAPGTLSVEVRLTERTGNPRLSVVAGNIPGNWGYSNGLGSFQGVSPNYLFRDPYGINYNHHGSISPALLDAELVTLASPEPGTYTIAVRATQRQVPDTYGLEYVDATANLRVVARAPTPLNFASSQNGSGGTNSDSPGVVSDGQRSFYEVTVPPLLGDAAPLGWKLSASTAQGAAQLYVYANTATLGAPIAQSTDRTLILAPPYFTAATYLVEVRAVGTTEFTLTSDAIVPRNIGSPWEIPTAENYSATTDIGDSGTLDLANGDFDFYVVNVPEGNIGVFRTVIEAVSGNPNLYVRRLSLPSRHHTVPGGDEDILNNYAAFSRSLQSTTGTEYGNWVPYHAKTETQLRPGPYYLAVHAASDTNLRYRLRVSPGDMQTLALNGGSVSNQLLTGGDWRYYKFQLPADSTVPQSWSLTFTQTAGDAIMFIRDGAPPGFSENSTVGQNYYNDTVQDWQRDLKNGDASAYGRYDNPGIYSFDTPPLRPGAVYYVGFYAKTDSTFGLSSTSSGIVSDPTEINHENGAITDGSIPAGSAIYYRLTAPTEAGRLRFTLTPSAPIELAVEQGTPPSPSGTSHYRNSNWTSTTPPFDYTLSGWPWIPDTTYYLRLANSSASPITFSLTTDGGRVGIVQSPTSLSLEAGDDATFSVVAGGSPTLTYQWQRDGVLLEDGGRFSGVNTASLSITSVITADNGNYQVDVSNTTAAGPFTVSAGASLAVDGVPLITTQPGDYTVNSGGAAVFQVVTYSKSTVTYQWQRSTDEGVTWNNLVDGASIYGSTGSYLQLQSTEPDQGGDLYRALITNAFGTTTTDPAELLVRVPPTIQTQPLPQTLAVGQTATFTVVATGIPAPSYQWRKNSSPISGATAASLELPNVQPSDADNYSVVVSNNVGNVTSEAVALTVQVPVEITTSPQSQTVLGGANVTLTVTASGSPTPTYQWRKAGENIPDANATTLSLTNVQPSDAGDYDVVVSNPLGSLSSDPATLIVQVPVSITAPPTSQTVLAGSTVSLTVTATGIPQPTYQWRRNAQPIDGATGATLELVSVLPVEAGNYDVIVTNALGSVTSATATLTVQVPVSISAAPASQTVLAGTDVTFNVTASGLPAPSYQWRKNGVPITGATTASLQLTSVQLAAAGDYDVMVSNVLGSSTSVAATLAVQVPVTISASPESQTVLIGSNVTLAAAATGTPAPTFQWRKDGENLAGETAASLHLFTVQLANAGDYDVVVTNSVGSVTSDPAALIVQQAVAIDTSPTDQTVVAGTRVELTVAATGFPLPTYQWRKAGVAIGGATGASLIFDQIRATDAGSYEVLVTNEVGTETSATATLTVHVPVEITTQPVSQSIQTGAALTLSVIATGTPTPTYQWRKNGEAISNATNASYTIAKVQEVDAGNYDVVVSNLIGDVTSTEATITVQSGPVITEQPAGGSFVVGTLVELSVRADGAALLSYQWRKDGEAISGATSATLNIPTVSFDDAGGYDVVLTNPIDTVTSDLVQVAVFELAGTHAYAGRGYRAGTDLTVNNTITFTGALGSFGYTVLPPVSIDGQAWSFVSSSGAAGQVAPLAGDTELFEWAWTSPPTSPIEFAYTLSVPANVDGEQQLIAVLRARIDSAEVNTMVNPDPLVVPVEPSLHDADTDRDNKLSLSELLRVIELYNARNGSVRTGRYRVNPSSEDGFEVDLETPRGTPSDLTRHHSADSNGNAELSLSELLRVIELYNFREGTRRTGVYHLDGSTEDGFAAGPEPSP